MGTSHISNASIIKTARGSMIVVFLALIRCIGEVFRLQHIQTSSITFQQIEPFIVGAMAAAIGCLIMTMLSFYLMYKSVIGMGIITIIALVVTKIIFHLA